MTSAFGGEVLAAQSNAIRLGTLAIDARATEALGFLLPIAAGDDDQDAIVALEYKETGSPTWIAGMGLVRIEPRYAPTITSRTTGQTFAGSPRSFAGIITGLAADTAYDIRVTVTDPDGIDQAGEAAVQSLTVSTRAIPPANPATPNTVNVSNVNELTAAVAAASPGDVITLAAGTYALTRGLFLRADGTEASPIVVRGGGATPGDVILDRNARNERGTRAIHLWADHAVVENLTVEDADTAIRAYGPKGDRETSNIVVRNVHIRDVKNGVSFAGWGVVGGYIANNVIEGNEARGHDAGRGKGAGIEVVGQDIEIVNNTISGFIDSFGTSNLQGMMTKGVFARLNKVLWGSDDCYEFDFSSRNVAAYRNFCANTAAGLSFQPVYDGPVYAFRNVVYNVNRGPLKVNPEAGDTHGGRVFHNTFVKAERGWAQFGGNPSRYFIANNLFIGQGSAKQDLHSTSKFSLTFFDHNAWFQNRGMQFINGDGTKYHRQSGANFAAYVARGTNSRHDVLLRGETVFANVLLDFDVNGWTTWRDPDTAGLDFNLDPGSSAVDGGLVIPGFNEDFAGKGPDIGAFERTTAMPAWGATWAP